MKTFVIWFVLNMIVAGCKTPAYVLPYFKTNVTQYKKIAFIPVKMHFSGARFESLSQEKKAETIVNYSFLYQRTFSNIIRTNTEKSKRLKNLEVQYYSMTNEVLKENKVSLDQVREITPSRLTEILGVDLICNIHITQNVVSTEVTGVGNELLQAGLILLGGMNRYSNGYDGYTISLNIYDTKGEQVYKDQIKGSIEDYYALERNMNNGINRVVSRFFKYID